MACSCGSGGAAGSQANQVKSPDGTVTSWRTPEEAEAAAQRTGGTVL